ncbi:tRNA (adenosine(37)-N6)-threonylcarbamoyltransferase complex dimerization subunit type 1 TsaB [Reinekea marinisedimentorum]|nr:tRNA (adenosine(37)-N6)-threonylcarbamoyltransferase complex dimerization subunit type 1 TsaB [Reinekea marinisedimentorum]
MNILSIDTTADLCSIALDAGGNSFVFHESRPREHAKILLPEITRLFHEAGIKIQDLDLVVFGRGPGSFTGVRIAASVAQGIALAAGCPVFPVSTLQSVAFSAAKNGARSIWVALDARMSEWYFARYNISGSSLVPELIDQEQVLPPAQISQTPESETTFCGNGWATDYPLPEQLAERTISADPLLGLPHALHSLELVKILMSEKGEQAVAPEQAIPVYLRDKVTWDNKPKVGS